MKEKCQFYPQSNYLNVIEGNLLKVSSNLVLQSRGKLQSPYINMKTKEKKTLQRLLLGGSLLTFYTWSKTPRDITDLSFRDSSEKSCYKIHLTQQGHVHPTKVEPSKQSEELLPVLWSVTTENYMWFWYPKTESHADSSQSFMMRTTQFYFYRDCEV